MKRVKSMEKEIAELKKEFKEKFSAARGEEDRRRLYAEFLGRGKGKLTGILRKISALDPAEKKIAGEAANRIKAEIENKFKTSEPAASDRKFSGAVDVTLPGTGAKIGHLHPVTLIQTELEEIFSSMGFKVLSGPELESDYYCFQALNIPAYHPARDMQDTFYIDHKNAKGEYDLVMRAHTSPMQVRAMQKYGAPLRCVVPGRVFRAEATDACHEHTFYQMEGLMVDENISIANMISVMKELLKGIFGQDMEARVRPGYFPFVEPAIELDIRCTICGGKGCPACKRSGWLEILPAGMVHPRVLEYGGIDPKKYSGFAFGLGLTRLAMMKYKIDDIRLLTGGDLRFFEQF